MHIHIYTHLQVILNSPAHNAHLPHSILGFFVPKGAGPITADLGYGIVIDVVQVPALCIRTHMRACMHAYKGLREAGVPMQHGYMRCIHA